MIKDPKRQAEFFLFIFGLLNGKFEMMEAIAKQLGSFDNEKVKAIYKIFVKYRKLIFANGIFGIPKLSDVQTITNYASQGLSSLSKMNAGSVQSSIHFLKAQGKETAEKIKGEMVKASKDIINTARSEFNELFFRDIFKRFDKDRSGSLHFNEFCDLCKFMGLYLDEESLLKLFAEADRNGSHCIESWEFEYTLFLIKKQIAMETLYSLGFTLEDLIWIAIWLMIYLILLLIFIFVGIFAFSKAVGFNAVVNSLMPLAAGIACAAKKVDIQSAIDKVREYAKELIQRIKRN